MRISSVGHVVFALAMIGLGIQGLIAGDFAQIWQPVPKWVPAHTLLAYLTALVSLGCGVGLLWRRTALTASRVLFGALLLWVLLFRLPNFFYEKPVVLVGWTFGATAVMLAGAWVLYAWFAAEEDQAHVGFITGPGGLRVARVLFGLSFVPFGLAHFLYLDATTVLIPNWLPWHTGMAYLTGSAFIAGGLAVAVGVVPRLAAALLALQMGLFGLIVWAPRVATGNLSAFQKGEVITTLVLMAGAWVVADSYRGMAWLSVGSRQPAYDAPQPGAA